MLLLLLYLFAFVHTQQISSSTSNVEVDYMNEILNINGLSNNTKVTIDEIVTKILDYASSNATLEKDVQNFNDNNINVEFMKTINNSTPGDTENSTDRNEIIESIKKVKVQFLYETECPYSRRKYPELVEIIKELGSYIELTTYPFGNARMSLSGSELSIECQHGEKECYGNRLHACAIDELKDPYVYVPFNSCMMRHKKRTNSNNDVSVDTCGSQLNVATEEIKSCAKDYRGFLLLVNYGIESKKLKYPGVPWWFVNDVPKKRKKSLMETICAEIKEPPPICKSSSSSSESDNDD